VQLASIAFFGSDVFDIIFMAGPHAVAHRVRLVKTEQHKEFIAK
jgi:hypothetical protein